MGGTCEGGTERSGSNQYVKYIHAYIHTYITKQNKQNQLGTRQASRVGKLWASVSKNKDG